MEIKKEHIIIAVFTFLCITGGIFVYIRQYYYNQNMLNNITEKEISLNNVNRKEVIADPRNNFKNNQEEEQAKIIIHIAGQVKKPGVYELTEKSRVIDALIKAGGETRQAYLDGINLAAAINDGQKIYIPAVSSKDNGSNINSADINFNQEKININTADISELESLTGIGTVRAKNIIEYRNNNGAFKKLEQLLEVNGIGEVTFQNIKDECTL